MGASLRGAAEVRRLLQVVLASALLLSLLGLAQALAGLDWPPQAHPPAATFVNRNIAAAFVVATLPLALAFLPAGGVRSWVPLAALAVMGAYVLLTLTRSAWLALAVEGAVLAAALAANHGLRALLPVRMAWKLAAAALVAVLTAAIALWAAGGPPGLERARDRWLEAWASIGSTASAEPDGSEVDSARLRTIVWRNTLAMARSAPVLGVGLGNHRVVYPAWSRAAAVDPVFGPRLQLDHVHNDYLQVLAELGLAGLGLLLWAGVAVVRTVRRIGAAAGGDVRALALAPLLGLIGLAVDAFFSFPLRQAIPPLLIATYLAALAALDPERRSHALPLRARAQWAAAAALVAVVAVLAAAVRMHARWIEADRHALRMLRAQSRNDWAAVRAEAERAHRLHPSRREPLLALGAAHLAMGRPADAIPALETLRSRWPYDLNTMGNLALAWAALGGDDQAMAFFRRVIAIEPEDALAHHHLAELLERQGRPADALAEHRLAVRHAPRNAAYLHRWGTAALAQGRAAEAREALGRALAVDPDRAATHKALGVLLFEVMGQRAEGARHLRRALALDPQDRDAPRIRAMLAQAQAPS